LGTSALTAPRGGLQFGDFGPEVAAVIACIIESGVKEGRDDDRKRLLTELFVEFKTVPGFLSKETFDDVDRPGRRIPISYWADPDACTVGCATRHMSARSGWGTREVFSHYNVKIAAIERETDWTAPAPSMA
jgi:heme-degrading monooxygenase HmoA